MLWPKSELAGGLLNEHRHKVVALPWSLVTTALSDVSVVSFASVLPGRTKMVGPLFLNYTTIIHHRFGWSNCHLTSLHHDLRWFQHFASKLVQAPEICRRCERRHRCVTSNWCARERGSHWKIGNPGICWKKTHGKQGNIIDTSHFYGYVWWPASYIW